MTRVNDFDGLEQDRARLVQDLLAKLDVESLADPGLPEVIQRLIESHARDSSLINGTMPPDGGLADLIGIGSTAPADLGETVISPGVIGYDDTLNSQRLIAAADLYYLYMNESIG